MSTEAWLSAEVEIERLKTELAAAREVINRAALETYTPAGAEIVVSQLIEQQAELRQLRAEVAHLEWQLAGRPCACGDSNGSHRAHCNCQTTGCTCGPALSD